MCLFAGAFLSVFYNIRFLFLFLVFLVLLVKRVFFFLFCTCLFVCFFIREKSSKLTKKQQRQKEIKSKAGIYERGMRTCCVSLFFSSPRDSFFFFDGAAKPICRKLYTIQASYPVINNPNICYESIASVVVCSFGNFCC